MKRFLSLFALIVVPAVSWSAEAAGSGDMVGGTVEKMKCMAYSNPVSPRDEMWTARTDASATWEKLPRRIKANWRSYQMYSLNTIQPINRSEDMHDTFFGFGGVGTRGWDETSWALGLGTRHLTACGGHMFGFGASFGHYDIRHVEIHGPGVNLEWRTPFTTLTYGYSWNRLEVERHAAKNFFHHRHEGNVSSLDLSFQVPYLPWTNFTIGKTWYGNRIGRKAFSNHRGLSLRHFDASLRMNLLGCLALEGGRVGGFKTDHFIRLILSFGRPASNEYALTDGIVGNEAFTARDLRNYGLAPIARTRVE